jgi:hypothetical protein
MAKPTVSKRNISRYVELRDAVAEYLKELAKPVPDHVARGRLLRLMRESVESR